jgi:pimeloyl-ACP methyl ester carboxylesterase
MPYASSGDAKIYYEVHGAGPAVLFVHGSGGHHAAWWQQVAALSR